MDVCELRVARLMSLSTRTINEALCLCYLLPLHTYLSINLVLAIFSLTLHSRQFGCTVLSALVILVSAFVERAPRRHELRPRC